VIADKKY
jgi:exosome complex exonuclease RRP6